MFSCALFCAGSDGPLPAETSDVSVKVIGTVGQGRATCSYTLDRDRDGLLLYVPSLLSLHSATRQHVRLSGCQVSVAQSSGGKTVTHPLKMLIDDSDLLHDASHVCNGRDTEACLPEYNELRQRYKASVSKLCGSHSYEDVLLHVGDLPQGSQLSVCFEFLTRFSSSNQCPPVLYTFRQSLPSLYHSYNLLLASLCPVADVEAAGSLTSFSWDHIYEGKQHRNLVQVSYTTTFNSVGSTFDEFPGINLHLESGMSAGSCCSLSAPITERKQNPILATHDGVMMLSSVFTPHQLPSSLKLPMYMPSEFVFVVDCSGSMSGSNIQTAADTLITCVKSLPTGSYFNVIAFGSTYRKLFHNSEPYTQNTMDLAVQFANQLQASLGGTELLGPLHWIFKAQRSPGLSCQVLIITDGGVTNTTSVLRCVKRNRHQARCHTFGIGGEVCRELVTGIAAASGGQCVLLSPGQRLQTKVMEVLKDSMQPSMSNVVLQWYPPRGYTVVDSSPRNVGTLFSGNSYSAFAFLRKSNPSLNGTHDTQSDVPTGRATLTGLINGEQVEVDVTPVTLPSLTDVQSGEIASLLSQSAAWSKICDLELQALCNSRKNSHNDGNEDEPPTKKPRLNGTRHVTHPAATKQQSLPENPLREELTKLSMASGILCPLTYLQSDCGTIRQIIPLPHSSLSKPGKPSQPPAVGVVNRVTPSIRYRKRKRQNSNHHHSTKSDAGFSLSSIAKNTFCAIGSTLKTVVNITTFGLMGQESDPIVENGQSIEDEIEYQEKRHSQLHWDETMGKIEYPDIYYRSHPENTLHNRHNRVTSSHIHNKRSHRHSSRKHHPARQENRHLHHHKRNTQSPAASLMLTAPLPSMLPPEPPVMTTENHSAEEDDSLTISDTESDSSVDPDWEDLHKPSELLPLIHLQLFSGAWPLVRAFSYAVGVPLEEMRKLPLTGGGDTTVHSDTQHQMNGHTNGDEKNAHLWATALAVTCLEEHFPELQSEWEVVAYKGHRWIECEIQNTALNLEQVQRTARELVQRQS